jgi:hypothetical protein
VAEEVSFPGGLGLAHLMRPVPREWVLQGFAKDPTKVLHVFHAHLSDMHTSVVVTTTALSADRSDFKETVKKILDAEEDEERAKEILAEAIRERAAGYPTVYSNFAINLWSVTDALFRDLARAWLSGPSSIWRDQKIMSHQVDVRQYEIKRATGEVGDYLLRLVQEGLRTKGKTSVPGKRSAQRAKSPFERWLHLVKQLGLPVTGLPKAERETIIELSLVRNLLAHSPGGRVDQQFLDAWPSRWNARWPDVKLGNPLPLRLRDIYSYVLALYGLGARLRRKLEARIEEMRAAP